MHADACCLKTNCTQNGHVYDPYLGLIQRRPPRPAAAGARRAAGRGSEPDDARIGRRQCTLCETGTVFDFVLVRYNQTY
jgi:hypothetical protein